MASKLMSDVQPTSLNGSVTRGAVPPVVCSDEPDHDDPALSGVEGLGHLVPESHAGLMLNQGVT